MHIINFLQVIHIHKRKTSTVILNGTGDLFFAKSTQWKTGKEIVASDIFLTFDGSKHIGYKLIDRVIGIHIQRVFHFFVFACNILQMPFVH